MNNTTLISNTVAARLSIAPNPERFYCDRQLALLIFIAIWIVIFLIDTLLRCNDIVSRRAKRRHPPTTIHKPPYELEDSPQWRQLLTDIHAKASRN